MANDAITPSALRKRAAAAVAAYAVLLAAAGVGVNWQFVKETPTGESASRNLICWRSASGSGLCIRENGSVNASGSYLVNGASAGGVTAAGQGLSLIGSTGVRLASTITGSLLEFQTVSGATVHAQTLLRSSGALVVEGAAVIRRSIGLGLCDGGTACATGSGIGITIPPDLNNTRLNNAVLSCGVRGATGTMTVQVINITQNKDLFSTKVTVDSAEFTSNTAATPYVINTTGSANIVSTDDILMPRIDGVHTTPCKVATIRLDFTPQ